MVSAMVRILAMLVLCVLLTACESAAERAARHFESAKTLAAAGDTDRALVELRNVFELDPGHREGRAMMARIYLERGEDRLAYQNYLRLVEQYPDEVEGRIVLAQIAFENRAWDELDRHGAEAEKLAPQDPRVKAISLARRYRAAAVADDGPAQDALVAEVSALAETSPDDVLLQTILVDAQAREGKFEDALGSVDRLIALRPDDRDLYNQRLSFLSQMGDEGAIETQLKEMIARFPDDATLKATLVRLYLARRDLDAAEAFLRSISDPKADPPGAYIDLIRFLAELRSPEAAHAEIERGIAENPASVPLRAVRAGLDFEAGERDKAVSDLEAILNDAQPSAETNNVRLALAKMFSATGNEVGARRLIEEVLAADATQVEALKMKAAWQIRDDDTDGAIAGLRAALDKAPQDAQVMSMLADAYTRAGSHDLARDYLALAAEASGNAPAETIRYARRLMNEKRWLPAEDVLLPALRLAPGNVDLLVTLGQIYIAMKDEGRATQVVDTLRRQETAQATTGANEIETALRNTRGGSAEVMSFLEGLAASEDADLGAKLALLRAKLAAGQTAEALTYAESLVAADPASAQLRFALAAARSADGDLAGAEELYRELLAQDRKRPQVWLQLAALKSRESDGAAVQAVIDEGLAELPNHPDLLWAKAGYLERDGDIDGAIAIYEELYKQSSNSVIVANNLASLLSTYRDDDASLERAWTVARRLNGTSNPAFQDTYGWIAFRRGQAEEALPYLESAAATLTDSLVQIHLGLTYAALGRRDEAVAQLTKALDAAGPADTRPQVEEARAELARLRAAPATP
jgi:tetratricopeptide (TPR) repeat protein